MIGTAISAEFTSKERDAETGLDYFGARYFSSAQGRFTSADAPLADQHAENPQSWNLYSYTLNNPTRYVDPNGRGVVEGLQKAVDDVGVGFLTVVFQPDRVASGLWNAATHPGETLSNIGTAINNFANSNLDQKVTTLTEVAAPMVVGGVVGKLATAAEVPTTLGNAAVTVTHFTSAAGVAGITESGGVLRSGTFVTVPGQVPAGASSSTAEKLLEIGPGKGTNSVTFQTPNSNLMVPANGTTTSGGAIQFQLKNSTRVDTTTFKPTPPPKPPCVPGECGN